MSSKSAQWLAEKVLAVGRAFFLATSKNYALESAGNDEVPGEWWMWILRPRTAVPVVSAASQGKAIDNDASCLKNLCVERCHKELQTPCTGELGRFRTQRQASLA